MPSTIGQRGKYAEKQVATYLNGVNTKLARFAFLRLPDARTAMGRGTAMPADFEFFAPGIHGLLEVKEVSSPTRLPAKNVTQLPAMRARHLAGGDCYIIVYHTKTKLWRRIAVMDLDIKDSGSWDLSQVPAHESLADALPLTIFGATP